PDTLIRFIPNADYVGGSSFQFRAWDQSIGAVGDLVDASVNGADTPLSAVSDQANVTVTPVNDAPELDVSGDPTFTTVAQDATAPTGDRVSDLIADGTITDADGAAVEAIAVTAAATDDGVWQYSTDGGTSFQAVGAVSETSALLLGPDALLRFVPTTGFAGDASIAFRAWDRSAGAEGAKVDTSTNGGAYAFSTQIETASVTVNSAPTASAYAALDFSGTSSFVNAGDNYDPDNGDLTVEAWFYWDGSASGSQTIVSKGASEVGEEGYSMKIIDGALVLTTATQDSDQDKKTAATHIDLSGDPGWRHVAMVLDQEAGNEASAITGYLNGSDAGWVAGYDGANETFTKSNTDTTEDFLIGADQDPLLLGLGDAYGHYFNSQIADVRVWTTARSQAEIEADMFTVLDGSETDLAAHWRLDDVSGGVAVNSVSGGVDGTVTGGASVNDGAALSIAANEAVSGRIAAEDPEGDALTFSVADQADHGTASIDADTGVWVYTPDEGYTGADTISYQVTDAYGGLDTVSVTITVS
ncbi:MAG: LamG-like jellyroll fold domain-containing protein, partial [Pseudomonadota bacterium]